MKLLQANPNNIPHAVSRFLELVSVLQFFKFFLRKSCQYLKGNARIEAGSGQANALKHMDEA